MAALLHAGIWRGPGERDSPLPDQRRLWLVVLSGTAALHRWRNWLRSRSSIRRNSEAHRRSSTPDWMCAAYAAAALASYLRTIRSGDSRYDCFVAGRRNALNAAREGRNGVHLAMVAARHVNAGPTFTDEKFHNTGVAWRDGGFDDEGRFAVYRQSSAIAARSKRPRSGDLTRTAPYMHDGSLATLDDVVEFYSQGGRQNPKLDPLIKPRNFTAQEKLALHSFLKTLTGRIQEGGG